ncbi:MAG TPA: capsule assembly Wzi family protein [Longimicrobium sp.]|nr:capsule assembly Wzi family protein [Longimicrobium sp.]
MALFLAVAPGAAAQTDSVGVDTARRVTWVEALRDLVVSLPDFTIAYDASPLLPPGHWAVRAAGRLEGVGLAPSYLPAQGAVPRAAVFAALLEAASAVFDDSGHPPRGEWEALLEGWLERFVEEFPEYGPVIDPVLLGGEVGAGYAETTGVLSPAIGYFAARQDPRPVADRTGAFARAAGGVMPGRAAIVAGEVLFRDGEVEAPRWEVAAGARGWQLSAGRAEVRYGPGRFGGVSLSPREALPRIELQRTRPLRLPGFLRHAGLVTGHVFAGPMLDEERHATEPWLFGARLGVRPHPRLTLGINRAAIFGGEGRPATLRNLAGLAVGVIRSSDFENQILSFDARLRLPTEALLPATVYLEWGADDGAGALNEQPGWVAGLSVPAIPGMPEVSAGVEAARFAGCCLHGAWYFNATFPGNWARGDQPLGHPLGGEGWERAAYASGELLDARLRIGGRFYQRERTQRSLAEVGGGNLFSPWRTGRSDGGEVEAALRIGRAEARAAWARETGTGWREQAVSVALSAFF